jgi:hypothetical protein
MPHFGDPLFTIATKGKNVAVIFYEPMNLRVFTVLVVWRDYHTVNREEYEEFAVHRNIQRSLPVVFLNRPASGTDGLPKDRERLEQQALILYCKMKRIVNINIYDML